MEMESSSLSKFQINIYDNSSLCEIEASFEITGGHGIVERVLARTFENWRQGSNGHR